MKILEYRNLIFLVILICIFVFFIKYSNELIQKNNQKKQEILKLEKLEKIKKTLDVADIKAKAVSVYDITDGEFIYGKNENQVLPIASLVKIITSLVALKDKNIKEIEITKEDLNQYGDDGFYIGEKWQKESLIIYSLIGSSNDAAHALGKDIEFIKKMNDYVKEIGLVNTSFLNSTGLDIKPQGLPGGLSTAKEINLFSARAWRLYPDIFNQSINSKITLESISGTKHEVLNTNIIVDEIPNIIFSKTGYTILSGGNLVIIFKNYDEHYMAISVLNSTQEDRFLDIQNIVNVLYNRTYE